MEITVAAVFTVLWVAWAIWPILDRRRPIPPGAFGTRGTLGSAAAHGPGAAPSQQHGAAPGPTTLALLSTGQHTGLTDQDIAAMYRTLLDIEEAEDSLAGVLWQNATLGPDLAAYIREEQRWA